MRMTTVSFGWITTQALTSGEPSCARDHFGSEWQFEAEAEAAGDGGGADDEGATIHFHGVLLRLSRASWIAARTSWNVPQRQMLVIAASMSASVGLGFCREQRRGGHDHAGLAVAALRHLVLDPGLLHLVQRLAAARGLRWW